MYNRSSAPSRQSTLAHMIVIVIISIIGMMTTFTFKRLMAIDGPELFLSGVIIICALLFFYDDLHTSFRTLLAALTTTPDQAQANTYAIEDIYLITSDEGVILYHYAPLTVDADPSQADQPPPITRATMRTTTSAEETGSDPDSDQDLIDGMLTTVQQFCQDSMKIDERDHLNVLRFGSKKVLIEHGESVYLVVIGMGEDDGQVLGMMRSILSRLADTFGDELAQWGGTGTDTGADTGVDNTDPDTGTASIAGEAGSLPDLTPYFAPILGYSSTKRASR